MKSTPESRSNSHASEYRSPRTVEDVTERNVQTILQLEERANAARSNADLLASAIARFCGSTQFVWVHVLLFTGWLVFNMLSGVPHFDPFPFTFLTLVVSLEAIFLSTFILISQNHEQRLSERRNQLDLQINLLAEQENTKMLALLLRIAEKVGVRTDGDPTVQVLEEATRPEKLVDQIERATNKASGDSGRRA